MGISGRKRSIDNSDEDLLDEAEAFEFTEFDPSVEPKDSHKSPNSSFVDKYSNRTIKEEETEAMIKEFPKPSCKVLSSAETG